MKAVLVFCEGRHDVVFAQRSLGVHGGCQWVGKAIGELPSPFGPSAIARKGLIATRIERHAIEDLTIQAAAHSPLPSFESVVENTATDTIFFMVRANGKTQSDPILSLLDALSVTVAGEPVGTFEVSEYAAAFLFDANGEGVASTLSDFGDPLRGWTQPPYLSVVSPVRRPVKCGRTKMRKPNSLSTTRVVVHRRGTQQPW